MKIISLNLFPYFSAIIFFILIKNLYLLNSHRYMIFYCDNAHQVVQYLNIPLDLRSIDEA
jgi:hypothetical protein